MPLNQEEKRLGVYIHIPFCASRCGYCDFCSLANQDKLMPHYQDALLIQMREVFPQLREYYLDSVFFGGGTPSYYGAERLAELLQEVKRTGRLLKSSEITVECNPDSIKRKGLRLLRREGVNRISIGAQSANDEILRLIGRRHTWRQVEMAVKRAKKAGFRNISLDLIYGLPSQSKDDWARTLAKAVALKPTHISCYGLRLEEGTPMYRTYMDSPLLPSDDEQADMYLYAVDFLERRGYRQYEISNFARPGFESRHNLKYWRVQEYVGFGAAAHSYVAGLRYYCLSNVRGYISGVLGEKNIVEEQEPISQLDQAAEYIMLGMRTAYGICREDYTRVYRSSFEPLEQILEAFAANGWAVKVPNRRGNRDRDRWRFTPSGFLVSNVLIGMLLEAQTKEKFSANPWIREAFERVGEKLPLPEASEPYMN